MGFKINWSKKEVIDWNSEVERLEGELAYARIMARPLVVPMQPLHINGSSSGNITMNTQNPGTYMIDPSQFIGSSQFTTEIVNMWGQTQIQTPYIQSLITTK